MNVQRSQRAFSLIELAMVVATMGAVAAIAAPRMSNAATTAHVSAVKANLRILQNAVDFYAAEHGDRSPALDKNGLAVSADDFEKRLVSRTDETGNTGSGIYGPYLRAMPRNPGNRLRTVRIDGDEAGADKAGWRFDSASGLFMPDDPRHAALLKATADLALGDKVDAGLKVDEGTPVEKK